MNQKPTKMYILSRQNTYTINIKQSSMKTLLYLHIYHYKISYDLLKHIHFLMEKITCIHFRFFVYFPWSFEKNFIFVFVFLQPLKILLNTHFFPSTLMLQETVAAYKTSIFWEFIQQTDKNYIQFRNRLVIYFGYSLLLFFDICGENVYKIL